MRFGATLCDVIVVSSFVLKSIDKNIYGSLLECQCTEKGHIVEGTGNIVSTFNMEVNGQQFFQYFFFISLPLTTISIKQFLEE